MHLTGFGPTEDCARRGVQEDCGLVDRNHLDLRRTANTPGRNNSWATDIEAAIGFDSDFYPLMFHPILLPRLGPGARIALKNRSSNAIAFWVVADNRPNRQRSSLTPSKL